jgi:cellobiose-specific phosphotransferase system component IIB
MKVVSIKDMIRKDVPIYYRNLYTGVVVIEMNKAQKDYRIDFSIETKPTGQKEINVNFIDTVDYPLLPINKELKNLINEMDNTGNLPV